MEQPDFSEIEVVGLACLGCEVWRAAFGAAGNADRRSFQRTAMPRFSPALTFDCNLPENMSTDSRMPSDGQPIFPTGTEGAWSRPREQARRADVSQSMADNLWRRIPGTDGLATFRPCGSDSHRQTGDSNVQLCIGQRRGHAGQSQRSLPPAIARALERTTGAGVLLSDSRANMFAGVVRSTVRLAAVLSLKNRVFRGCERLPAC